MLYTATENLPQYAGTKELVYKHKSLGRYRTYSGAMERAYQFLLEMGVRNIYKYESYQTNRVDISKLLGTGERCAAIRVRMKTDPHKPKREETQAIMIDIYEKQKTKAFWRGTTWCCFAYDEGMFYIDTLYLL